MLTFCGKACSFPGRDTVEHSEADNLLSRRGILKGKHWLWRKTVVLLPVMISITWFYVAYEVFH
jgi:hypothetical protein